MQIVTLAFGFIPELAAIPTNVRFSICHAAPGITHARRFSRSERAQKRNPSYRFGSVPSFAA